MYTRKHRDYPAGTRIRKWFGVTPSKLRYVARRRRTARRKTYMEYKEIKFHDIDVNDAIIAANGNIAEDSILTIAQGDTSSTRDGRLIFIKSVMWRYRIVLPVAAAMTSTSDEVRVIMYIDSAANQATAAVADILATDNVQSFKDLHHGGRFTFIHDKVFRISSLAGAGNGTSDSAGEVIRGHTMFKNFKRHLPIHYDSTAGSITEMTRNNIGVLLLSSDGLCVFTSKIRVRFHD